MPTLFGMTALQALALAYTVASVVVVLACMKGAGVGTENETSLFKSHKDNAT